MEPSPGTVDLASLAPPLRALVEGQQATVEALRAENAALTERNRRLQEHGPEAGVEDLHARVVSLTDRNRNLEDRNRRLEHLVRELRRAMFGKKSEKLHPDQLLLAFEELEGALAEAEAEADAPASTTPTPRAKRPAAERNLGHLPAHLPRIEQVIEPESILCPCGCGEMAKIGEDRTERLDIVPAQLQVIVTVRPKYACRNCEEGVTQAPAPAHLIEGALPTEGMLAHVLVSKFADHLPLYRQAQIYGPLRRRPTPFDAGRLGRQDVVPPAPRVRVPEGGAEDVEQPGAGRDHGPGARPGPGQNQDRLHVDDGARRAGMVRAGPAGRGV